MTGDMERMAAAGSSAPFRASGYAISTRAATGIELARPKPGDIPQLARSIAALDPWATLGIEPTALERHLSADDPHSHRWAIHRDARQIGVVTIRDPWLYGPYLALLVVFPGSQAAGLGTAVIDWMAHEARGARNLWVCASAFNTRALEFYERNGFSRVGVLDSLLKPGLDELLLRKRLT